MTEITISITKKDLVAIAKAKAKTAGIDIDALTLRPLDQGGDGLQVKPEWYALEDSDDDFAIPWFDIDAVSVTFRPKEVDPC
jgi:hypothetical protein